MEILTLKGVRFALAPLYLGYLYAKMDEYEGNITRAMGRCEMFTQVDSNFLQVLMWKRFPTIPLNPLECPTIVTEEVILENGSKKTKSLGTYMSLAWRWLNVKPLASKSLVKVLVKEENSASVHIPTSLKGCLLPQHLERPTRR